MIALLAGMALAEEPAPDAGPPEGESETLLLMPRGTPHVTLGNRLEADGVGTAVGVSEEFVVGGDGGTLATRVSARWATWKLVFAAHLPFATYRVPDGRTTGLGNLRLDAFHRIQKREDVVMYGLSAHIPLGRAYTWTNSAAGIWPGGGLTAVVQWRHATNGPVDLLARGALGLHGTAGFDPYPSVYLHASAAGGVDVPLRDVFGVTGEVAASVWDPSPFDASVWARVQPDKELEGFRGRFGMLLPLATWAGLSPSDKPAGVREMSILLDIGLAL